MPEGSPAVGADSEYAGKGAGLSTLFSGLSTLPLMLDAAASAPISASPLIVFTGGFFSLGLSFAPMKLNAGTFISACSASRSNTSAVSSKRSSSSWFLSSVRSTRDSSFFSFSKSQSLYSLVLLSTRRNKLIWSSVSSSAIMQGTAGIPISRQARTLVWPQTIV